MAQTSQSQTETELPEAVHAAPAAILVIDSRKRVVAASDSACTMLGWSREELVGLGLSELAETDTGWSGAKRRLTDRELEILQLLADGHENNEIARRLYISLETVKTHVRRLLKKLEARSRTHAVAIALRQKLVE